MPLWTTPRFCIGGSRSIGVESSRGCVTFWNIAIGGTGRDGTDVSNELTHIILRARGRVHRPNPNLSLRLSSHSSDHRGVGERRARPEEIVIRSRRRSRSPGGGRVGRRERGRERLRMEQARAMGFPSTEPRTGKRNAASATTRWRLSAGGRRDPYLTRSGCDREDHGRREDRGSEGEVQAEVMGQEVG
jgi:hypothetical protein